MNPLSHYFKNLGELFSLVSHLLDRYNYDHHDGSSYHFISLPTFIILTLITNLNDAPILILTIIPLNPTIIPIIRFINRLILYLYQYSFSFC